MEQSKFFHVCTDGTSNGIVFTCNADFQQAIIFSAIIALKLDIRVICYCHMASHSHFVVAAESEKNARRYIEEFKCEYAKYISRAYGISSIFKQIEVSVKEITDIMYLKNCIAYVLLNPVAANICRVPEKYEFSSFNAYFQTNPIVGRFVRNLKNREQRKLLRTNADLRKSSYVLNDDNTLNIRSFVDFKFVENLFGSQTWFYKSLALTNSVDEELKYAPKVCHYNDVELFEEIAELSQKRYGTRAFQTLPKSDKQSLIPAIERKTHVTVKRLARVLRLEFREISNLLGAKIDEV